VTTLFGLRSSGNCYKIALCLTQLGLPFVWHDMDMASGENRSAEFKRINPLGKVPAVKLTNGECLFESNAILAYFAEGTSLWPAEKLARARVLQWMFFEQYSHEPYVAVARYICNNLAADHPRRAELPRCMQRGHEALQVMDQHLADKTFFVGETYSVADIALYAYTHVAAEGGFDLALYPAIGAWLKRVAAVPNHLAIG
jgi:glutathione S-transferase